MISAESLAGQLEGTRRNGSGWSAQPSGSVDAIGPMQVFPAKNADALRQALELEGHFLRFNTRGGKTEWSREAIDASSGQPTGNFAPWTTMNDRKLAKLREKIATSYGYATSRGVSPLRFGRESFKDALDAILYDLERDPFAEWLEALPEWDGTPRCEQMLEDLFGCESTEVNRWASRYLTAGAVARTMRPGLKLDTVPVLVGPQGIGKSAVLQELFPAGEYQWFSDGLQLAAGDKRQAESLLGRVIVEASEMAGSSRAELESLKAFVTRRDDGAVRLAYRRNPETMLRRCIIVGTTNRLDSLPNDPSGNRRFLPVELRHGSNVEAYMFDARLQLWAEALARHRDGEPAALPRHLLQDAATMAERHRNRDVILEDLVADQIGEFSGPMTLSEIAEKIGFTGPTGSASSLSMRDQKRLGAALRNRDFYPDRRRVGASRRIVWVRD